MSNKNYIECSACGHLSEATQQNALPDNGLLLPYETFGYYGGFSDSMRVLIGHQLSKEWILCHDCVVKFLRTFPLLADSFGKGHHPCEDNTPCCEFAWRGTDNFAKRHNEMLVRTQTAFIDDSDCLYWQDDEPS